MDGYSFFARIWENVIAQPLREVDNECRAFQASADSHGVDRKPLIVMLTTAVVLTLQAYVTGADAIEWLARALAAVGLQDPADSLRAAMRDEVHGQLYQLLAWVGIRGMEWLLVPMLIVRLVFRERLADYGVKLRGLIDGWWLYLLMLAVVLPLVALVSEQPSFLATYPYYRLGPDEPLWPRLWAWEAAYFTQFFFLEFFFRGFMIHGTKHRFGAYSILVMMVPYCMIHFGKPMPETLGSIVAGLVLGFMSLKTRSIWMGTALHINVAMVMDLLALGHAGRLG